MSNEEAAAAAAAAADAKQLKLQALQLKKAGDVAGAKALLARAREIEFRNVTLDQVSTPADCKRLAVALKKRGDIGGARDALVKAKRLEAAAAGAAAAGGGGGGGGGAPEPPPEQRQQQQEERQHRQQRPPNTATSAQQVHARVPCLYSTASPSTSTRAVAATAAAASKERGPSGNDAAAAASEAEAEAVDDSNNSNDVTFTDEEMLDLETMSEMKTMGMESDIPSEDVYKSRVQHCKRAALACKKRGDMDGAKKGLVKAKKLEAVMAKLYNDDEDEDDDEEDYSLLDELNDDDGDGDDAAFMASMFGDDGNTLDLDDLEHIDAPMLRDMMDSGMEIPNLDDVLSRAAEKKALAVALHKDGNQVAAKAALAESKRLQSRADALAEMLEAIENGLDDDGDDMAALEAMLAGEGGGGGGGTKAANKSSPAAAAATDAAAAPPPEESINKPAGEYKLDAIRLKNENKLSEAASALRMYKKALVLESSAAEAKRRQEMIAEIQGEIALAVEQRRLFAFYGRFVDEHAGLAQLSFWTKYGEDCAKAAKAIETRGSGSIDIMRTDKNDGAMRINDEDDLGFVGRIIDPSELRLEVAVLDVLNMMDNKHLKKELRARLKEQQAQAQNKGNKNQKDHPTKGSSGSLRETPPPSLRVDVTIQLPPSEKEADENINFSYEPSIVTEDGGGGYYEFGPSRHVDIPRCDDTRRGTSRHAKTILRRMARKRIQITVYLVPTPKKKGLFGSKRPSTSETSLGMVVLELKDFLEGNFVAGDFPLMDSLRRNELGGMVRLGVRTAIPYDPPEGGGEGGNIGLLSKDVDMQPYKSMSFMSSSSGAGF